MEIQGKALVVGCNTTKAGKRLLEVLFESDQFGIPNKKNLVECWNPMLASGQWEKLEPLKTQVSLTIGVSAGNGRFEYRYPKGTEIKIS